MRVPEVPPLDHFKTTLDTRLRVETRKQKRAVFPHVLFAFARHFRALVKPLLQSGAMAMTAIVVIIAVSVTPAATTINNEIPGAAPLSAPDLPTLVSDSTFQDFSPADDVLAVQEQLPDSRFPEW